MKKILLLFLSVLCLPAFSQPLNLCDWKQPLIKKSVSNEVYTSVLNCEKKTPYYVFIIYLQKTLQVPEIETKADGLQPYHRILQQFAGQIML